MEMRNAKIVWYGNTLPQQQGYRQTIHSKSRTISSTRRSQFQCRSDCGLVVPWRSDEGRTVLDIRHLHRPTA